METDSERVRCPLKNCQIGIGSGSYFSPSYIFTHLQGPSHKIPVYKGAKNCIKIDFKKWQKVEPPPSTSSILTSYDDKDNEIPNDANASGVIKPAKGSTRISQIPGLITCFGNQFMLNVQETEKDFKAWVSYVNDSTVVPSGFGDEPDNFVYMMEVRSNQNKRQLWTGPVQSSKRSSSDVIRDGDCLYLTRNATDKHYAYQLRGTGEKFWVIDFSINNFDSEN